MCVMVQLNGNVQSSELRSSTLTVRLRDGSVIRVTVTKPSTPADLKTVHNAMIVAKNSSTECKYFCV